MAATRADLIFKAQLAEHSERYMDMANIMKKVAEFDTPLNADERNLLSVAYKNVVGPLRAGWRILHQIQDQEVQKGPTHLAEIQDYKIELSEKLAKVCEDISDLITNVLINNDPSTDGIVFYHKMNGDYARYLAEIQEGAAKERSAENAKRAYQQATDIAKHGEKPLSATHPILLGLALNYSVFYYEILEKNGHAISMAQSAFDDAMAELDGVDENSYKDATLIMQLLKDNLTLWNDECQESGGQKAQDGLEVEDL
jgi:hypothetical protein